MSKYKPIIALALAGFFSTSCQDPPDDTVVEPYRSQLKLGNGLFANGLFANGLFANGLFANGLFANGLFANGLFANGLSLSAVLSDGSTVNGIFVTSGTLNGAPVTDISVSGSQITATVAGGKSKLSGTALKGLIVKMTVPGTGQAAPTKITYRIDDVTLDTQSKFKDIWFYQVSSKLDSATAWTSLCLDYAGNPAPLFPIIGSYWDENTGARTDNSKAFTLACAEGALAKCAVAGYRPWASATTCSGSGKSKHCTDVPLQDYHQACTRMVRADYCGDGTPHTVNGTILDIFDYLNPPVQLQEEKWQMEARWKTDGAICLSQRRHPEIPFPGCLKVTDKKKPASLVQLPACQPYSTGDDRGLVVSTFNSMPAAQ